MWPIPVYPDEVSQIKCERICMMQVQLYLNIAISIWTVGYIRYKQYQRKLPPLYTTKPILESLRKLSKEALQEKGKT